MDRDTGNSPRPHDSAVPSDPPPRPGSQASAPPASTIHAAPTPELMAIAYRLVC